MHPHPKQVVVSAAVLDYRLQVITVHRIGQIIHFTPTVTVICKLT